MPRASAELARASIAQAIPTTNALERCRADPTLTRSEVALSDITETAAPRRR